MIRAIDMQARNQRVAAILLGVAALLCVGSMVYIQWFHTAGSEGAVTRAR